MSLQRTLCCHRHRHRRCHRIIQRVLHGTLGRMVWQALAAGSADAAARLLPLLLLLSNRRRGNQSVNLAYSFTMQLLLLLFFSIFFFALALVLSMYVCMYVYWGFLRLANMSVVLRFDLWTGGVAGQRHFRPLAANKSKACQAVHQFWLSNYLRISKLAFFCSALLCLSSFDTLVSKSSPWLARST